MDERTAEPTIASRNRADDRFNRLTTHMPYELRQAWNMARNSMGVVRAVMLLEDTYHYYFPNAQEYTLEDTKGEG